MCCLLQVNMQERIDGKKSKRRKPKISKSEDTLFSEDKIQAMKNLAQQISKSLTSSKPSTEVKPVHKSSYQLELEEERQRKLKEKERLKKLTPLELRELNRKKLQSGGEDDNNKIDDFDTNASFSKALEISEKTAELYHHLQKKRGTGKEVEEYTAIVSDVRCDVPKSDEINFESVCGGETSKKVKHKDRDKSTVYKSGTIDGEIVEGVVKSEVKKNKHKKSLKQSKSQDEYVLEKLFNKKGLCLNFIIVYKLSTVQASKFFFQVNPFDFTFL